MIKCKNKYCNAQYSRGGWVSGYRVGDPNDTSGREDIVNTGKIPDNVCPICKTPEELTNE